MFKHPTIQALFPQISSYITPINLLTDVPTKDLGDLSKLRIICPWFKQQLNQYYHFDELYFDTIYGQSANAMIISHSEEDRFYRLVELTKRARLIGKEIRHARIQRKMEITRRVLAKHQCPKCEVLLHPGSDNCEYCKFRLSVSCFMCTILIHQIAKRPHYQILCDECDHNIR